MNWNKDVAISHLRSRALGHSHNECAAFTREAIAAGGIRLERTLNAKDYGLHYYAYAQDYDPSWISALTVGAARPFMGGEVMPVWIGREGGKKLELEVFVRRESDIWKIYRVRDVTDNYEHPIFNAGAITRAKSAAESGL